MCSLVISMATSAQTFVALCLVMGTIVCGRPQRKQSDCANVRQKGISTVDLVCRSLWYIDEAMEHCSENGPCNHEALKEMKSGIQSTLCEWVITLQNTYFGCFPRFNGTTISASCSTSSLEHEKDSPPGGPPDPESDTNDIVISRFINKIINPDKSFGSSWSILPHTFMTPTNTVVYVGLGA
ncbi:hypothetical protein EMCRGX_G007903 [Ephydatia muelleri]